MDDDCDSKIPRHPRCNFVQVRSKARALGVADDLLARDDGTVAVIDSKSKKTIHLFEKHLVAIPGTGATDD